MEVGLAEPVAEVAGSIEHLAVDSKKNDKSEDDFHFSNTREK